MSTTQLISIAAGFIAVFALAIYLFGVPPETKRKMERTALNTMGENKVSYMAKGQINKIPDTKQQNIDQLKKGVGNALGGLTQNPLGEATGRVATQTWDSAQHYSKVAVKRVSTMTQNARELAARKAKETAGTAKNTAKTAMDKIPPVEITPDETTTDEAHTE